MATLPIRAWIIIEDGNTEIDYVNVFPLYTSPYEILDAPVTNITGQVPTETVHDNDDGPPDTINLEEQRRVWAFALKVTGANPAAVSKNISELRRHIQGKQSTAYQAYLNKSQPRVIFRMQLDSTGSSPLTDFVIQHGSIQDNSSYYRKDALINEIALDVNVNLICTPAGRGVSISLRNDLPSSPHFLEDSGGTPAGLADGWNASGTASYGLSSNQWLIGGKSQFVSGTSVGAGFFSATISVTDGVGAYVWTRIQSGTITYKTRNTTDGIDVAVYTVSSGTIAAAADMTTISPDGLGNTWYRLDLSGSVTGTKNVRIEIASTTTTSSFFVDMAYLQGGVTTAPLAYSSASDLRNRYDPTSANPERINYLDVAMVPGDMPAVLKTSVTVGGTLTNAHGQIYAKRRDGVYNAYDTFFARSGDFSVSGGTWTNTADATRISGQYWRAVLGAVPAFRLTYTLNRIIFSSPLRVFAYVRVSALTVALEMGISGYDADILTGTPAAINTWSLVDFGLLNLSGLFPSTDVQSDTNITWVVNASGTGTIDFNGVYFLPSDELFLRGASSSFASAPSLIILNGENRTMYRDVGSAPLLISPGGGFWTVDPQDMTRFIFISRGSTTNEEPHNIDNTFAVSLDVTPMASHLIGE